MGEPFDELEALMDITISMQKEEQVPRKRKPQDDEDEIDALVDELDDELEEEDVEEDDEDEEEDDEDEEEDDEEEEEDEDPDEAPKSRRKRSSKAKKAKTEKSGVGTVEVAAAAGTDPRQLRMYLRAKGIQPGDAREGRYHWPSLENREVQRIIKDIRQGAVDKMNKEKLAGLKGRKKSSAKKAPAKKSTRRRTRTKK